MTRLLCLFIIITVFSNYSNATNPEIVDSLHLAEEHSPVEFTRNNKYIRLSSMGFADNKYAAKKKVRIGDAVRFVDDYFAPPPSDLSQRLENASSHVDRAKAVFAKVRKNRAFLTALHGKKIDLPFGINKTIGTKEYTIVFDSIVITPEYAYSVIYTVLKDPQSTDSLAFGAKVTMSKDGGFASNGGKLFLLSDNEIPFGANNTVEFLGTNGKTYVDFDCNGFTGFNAEMKMTLLKDKLVLDSDKTKDVSFITEVYFENFNNWIIEVQDIPPFQFKELEDFTFSSKYLAFDRSASENPSGFNFPAGYDLGSDPNMWEGFCIDSLSVTLPPQFTKRNSTSRTTLAIENAIIDKMGFTGLVSATDPLPLGDGDMNGWDFSLERLAIRISRNQFQSLDFEGHVVIPVAKEDKPFYYTAEIDVTDGTRYFFSVVTEEDLEFPLWGASQVELYADSRVEVTIENGMFMPEAILSGKMDLSASINKEGENTPNDGASLKLAEINFQQLHITTKAPYLFLDPANGSFTVGSPRLKQALAKLPITISDVGLVTEQFGDKYCTGVNFTVRINLTGNNDTGNGFGANATAVVWGEKPENRWQYFKCELKRIEIERVAIGPLTLEGFLEFYRDDTHYGTGFNGQIKLDIELKSGNSIGIDVAAIFGKILNDDSNDIKYRYWAVDALFKFPVAVPVIPSLLYVNAFGGGASYKMAIQEDEVGSLRFQTLSGVGFMPDENTGLGLRSTLGIQGETASAYNGEVVFEIVFSTSGSVTDVAFSGYVAIAATDATASLDQMADKTKAMAAKVEEIKAEVEDKTKAMLNIPASQEEVKEELDARQDNATILAQWLMRMDFQEKVFTANIDVFVNAKNQIVGKNANNHAGRLDILFAPNEWHVYVGEPGEKSMGLRVELLGVEIGAYLVMGSEIPLPVKPEGYNGAWNFASNVKAGSVKGFGFGARLEVEKSKSGTFYYSINAGVGFDILLQNVKGKTCNETGQAFGFKNWYASGIAFLYLDVSAGLEVCINVPYLKCWKAWKRKCWGKRRKCANMGFDANLSASVTANAPNPTNVAFNFNVLGKSVALQIGKSCTF